MRVYLYVLMCVSILAGCLSCSDTDCTVSNTAYVYYGFYDHNGVRLALTSTVTVTAAGTDSILINQESNMNSMQLPLSYTNMEDTFVVRFSELLFDTIFVTHQNIPHFISMDCGTGMYHHIENVRCTRRVFDSVQIVNPDITYDAKEHIKIYCPSNN